MTTMSFPRRRAIPALLTHPVFHAILVVCAYALIVCYQYPWIGHDYRAGLSRGLDTYHYYLTNGVHIQWWTPWFGGGLPSYPDPCQGQFTLTQFLFFIVDPWLAIVISVIFFIGAGYAGVYVLLKRCLQAARKDATLGATLFCVSAYIIEHVSAGHLNYITFTFLPLIVWLLCDRAVPRPAAVCLIGLLLAYLIHSGGFYFAVIFGISIPLTIAIFCLVRSQLRFEWRDFSLVALFSMLLAAGIGLSKICAVHGFMRYFPRAMESHYTISLLKAAVGLPVQLFFGPVAILFPGIPVDHILRRMTGAEYGLWEMDAGLSPVILCIFCAACLLIKENPLRRTAAFLASTPRRVVLTGIIGIMALLAIEFTLARGFPFTLLKKLPILESLHSNTRNAAIFILPVVVIAVSLRRFMENDGLAVKILNPWALSLAAILLFSAYTLVPGRFGHTTYCAETVADTWKNIRAAPDKFQCAAIMEISDDRVLPMRASSRFPGMPIFGYRLEQFVPLVHAGRADDTSAGYFNMTNPSSLVYPAENGLHLFERITVNDRENFLNFIQNKPTTWKRWRFQQAVDLFSLVAFLATLLVLVLYAAIVTRKVFRSRPKARR